MTKNKKVGVVIAHLSKKQLRKTKENHSYYLLHLTLYPSLTQRYFQLTKQKLLTLRTNSPFYLFPRENKWGSKLKPNHTYLFHYQKRNSYLHLEDWKILGDYQTIRRAWRLLLN